MFDHLTGRRRGCTCTSRIIDTRTAEVKAGIQAAIARKDYLAVKLLALSPTIPKGICTCKPAYPERLARLRGRRPRRPLTRRPPSHELNVCFTGWPGGLNYKPPGAELAPGEARTGFVGGFATNPKCYPPRAAQLLDSANDGTFSGARRQATLGQTDPDRVAHLIGDVTRAVDRGTLTPDLGGKIIAGAVSPPVAANQAQYKREIESAEERRKRKLAAADTAAADAALEARYVTDVCRPVWCCYNGKTWQTSPTFGTTKDPKVVLARRAAGFICHLLDVARIRARLGHAPSEGELVGACADTINYLTADQVKRLKGNWALSDSAQRVADSITQPVGTSAPLIPAPSGAVAAPPAPAPRVPGVPYYDCVRTPFGFPIGEHVQGTQAELVALGVWATFPWACSQLG